jgi:hypothetical protein
VLANGTAVTASSADNPRLFRALKGGNNNLGVITRFDSKLYPQKEFWGGTLVQPVKNKDKYFDFMVTFSSSETFDPKSALITNFIWIAGLPVTIQHIATYSNGDVAWPPPAFKELAELPQVSSTVRKAKLSSFTDEAGDTGNIVAGSQTSFVSVSFVNKAGVAKEFMEKAFQLTDAFSKEYFSVLGLAVTLTFQPMPHALYSKDAASNVMGFERFDEDLINLLYVIIWTSPLDNERVYKGLQDLEADLVAAEKEMGVYNEWIYLNYAAQWQKPIESYGSEAVGFLKEVSKEYDPQGVFQKVVPGGFKLGI